jgi:fructose-bisphosphate aldolase, class I
MDKEALIQTARHLVQKGKGILAADESNSTADKRLKAVGVEEPSQEMRRQYRELLLMTPEIENYISGVILYEETLGQQNYYGESFVDVLKRKGIIPGIKVDSGSVSLAGFPDEEVTEGLDGLSTRISRYYELGARFAKWRAVIRIGVDTPTPDGVRANAHVLARYARICQEGGLVPIVEPEVLITGVHSIDRCETVLTETTRILFDELRRYRVELQALILKSSMALPGDESGTPMDPKEVAWRTVRALKTSVPAEVPGVVFLSGGQTPEEATVNLNEMAHLEPLPFEIAFSYARALQGPALEEWRGRGENWDSAQAVFLKRVQDTVKADLGEYQIS